MNGMPTPPVMSPGDREARQWNMFCHLSALIGMVFPFGNMIAPLVIWQMKKNEIPSVEEHGKASLNFQITVSLATLVLGVLAFILSFFCIGFLLIPFVALLPLAGMVFAVIAGIKANDGQPYKYPWSLQLV